MRTAVLAYLGLILLFGLARCVSRTVPEGRFQESRLLRAPLAISVPDPRNFSFAVVGDLHISGGGTTRLQTMLSKADAEGDAFFILLGDLVDQGVRSDVVAIQKALYSNGWSDRSLFVIGNHDIFHNGWAAYKELNGPSHYALTIGNSKFVALDTADGSLGAEETRWLEDQLAGIGAAHTFLLSHYLPVVPGLRTYLKLANQREASRLMKLASVHGVTAWLGGHYHSYALGIFDGVTYLVAGGGGGHLMSPVTDHFFVQVVVAGDQISYHLRIVP